MPRTSAAAAVTIGAENDVPSACRNSNGPQSEYPWFVADVARRLGHVARERREDVRAGRRDVVVLRVAVRELRDVAGRSRARSRRRRAAARPDSRRSSTATAAPGRSCRPRRRRAPSCSRRTGWRRPRAGEYVSRRGSSEVTQAGQAEVDHPRALVDRPADRLCLGAQRDRPVVAHDLPDQQLNAESRSRRCRHRCSSPRRSRRRRTSRGPACPRARSRRRSSSTRRSGPGTRRASRRFPSRSPRP